MTKAPDCKGCRDGQPLPFAFTMAFQPIVDVSKSRIWGYEALVRGTEGQPAAWVLSQITDETLYRFDQACRVRAIEIAGKLLPADDKTRLSINFLPNAVYEPTACIRASLDAARRVGLGRERLVFEFTEGERFKDVEKIAFIVSEYKRFGFLTALDDFGAGYAGLSLLAKLQPDLIKIDISLIHGIDADRVRQAIVAGLMSIARALEFDVIAEGVETEAELIALRAMGISLFQGFYFAQPEVEALPQVRGFPQIGA